MEPATACRATASRRLAPIEKGQPQPVPELPPDLLPNLDLPFAVLLATVLAAGVARGMSGFGTGMIVAPVAGALYGPKAALVIIVIIDSLPILPVTLPALRHAVWREVLPVSLGLALFLPLGVHALAVGDPQVLRWLISIAILACAASLWSGWRYGGPRHPAVSLGVGGVAGVLSGIAAIPGPPVILYWLASALPVAVIRANLLSLFFIGEILSIANIWAAGFLDRETVFLGVCAAPLYFAGITIGARLYGRASDATYRRVTFVMIVTAALLALPVVEPLFGMLAERLAG